MSINHIIHFQFSKPSGNKRTWFGRISTAFEFWRNKSDETEVQVINYIP